MLILFEHETGEGYIFLEENRIIKVYVSGNMKLYSLLIKLKRNGIPCVIEYSCNGKIRSRTVFKPIKDKEQILEFLQSFHEKLNIHNIEIFDNTNSDSTYEKLRN